jgi:2-polyprenyl-6-methoxyphenol hydroxylase-like FAD-dependent oxidoreductase
MHSTIARLVDAPIQRTGRYASAFTYGYWTGAEVHNYEWVFRPDAAAGALPTNDGQVAVFASATPERIGRGGADVIESIVRASAPDLAERLRAAVPPTRTRTFRGPSGFMRKPWGAGWALVGDAGYYKDPLSAHGMTDALRDAELLTRALAAALDGADESEVLARYQATRDGLSLPLFEVVDTIASHRWDDAGIGDLLKRLSSSMTDEVELLTRLDERDVNVRSGRLAA